MNDKKAHMKEIMKAMTMCKGYEDTPFYPLYLEFKEKADKRYMITFYGFMLRVKDEVEYTANVPYLMLDETISRTEKPTKLDLDSVKGEMQHKYWYKDFWKARGWVVGK